MRVISMPTRDHRRDPRPPSMWRTWWMPLGTIVEHNGCRWEKVWKGAADATWHEWERVKPTPMPKVGPSRLSRGPHQS